MSYDLYFVGRKLTEEEFSAYFRSRSYYKVEGSQALYQNEDTGVYFSFDRNRGMEKVDPQAPDFDVSFNINFFRPHIFGLEAEPEVNAFINAFGFSVHDPQNHGMGTGSYSSAGFFAGWNVGNEFGYQCILNNPQQNVASLATYPAERIEQIWRWNLNRNSVQAEFGESLFVPKIIFIRKDGKVASAIIWGDAIPTLIPKIDLVFVLRKALAPRVLFQKKEDKCLVGFSEVSRVLGRYLNHDYGLPSLLLPHPESPKEVRDFVSSMKPFAGKLEGISVDKVFDQELVDRHRPAA
jgi:hypothetical protein